MTTNKTFLFDIQMFANWSQIYASGGSVAISDTTTANGTMFSSTGVADTYNLVTSGSTSNTQVAATANVVLNGSYSAVGLSGVASDVAVIGSSATINLSASGSTLSWTGLTGGVSVSVSDTTVFSQTINGKAIEFTGVKDAKVGLSGTGSALSTSLISGGISFSTVGQDWFITKGASVALGTDIVAVDSSTTNATLNSGNYLNFSLGNTGKLALTTGGENVASLAVDGIQFGSLSAGTIEKTAANTYTFKSDKADESIVVNNSVFALGESGTATITGSGSSAYVSAIDKLGASQSWRLGDARAVTLGADAWNFAAAATLGGDATSGTSATTITTSGAATLSNTSKLDDRTLTFNSAQWTFGNATVAGFDATGNITGMKMATGGGSVALTSDSTLTSASITASAYDSAEIKAGATVLVNESNNITSISGGLVADSDWVIGGESVAFDGDGNGTSDLKVTFTSKKATDSVYGTLVANEDGTGIAALTGHAANVTVEHAAPGADTPFEFEVGDYAWTISSAATTSEVYDVDGNIASVAAGVVLYGEADAIASVNGTAAANAATLNNVEVAVTGDASVSYGLEAVGDGKGIASIMGVDANAAVKVSGDTEFALGAGKNTYQISAHGTGDNSSVTTFEYDGSKVIFGVEAGGTYSVGGGSALFTLAAAPGSADVDNSANVTAAEINGVAVSVGASDGDYSNFAIASTADDKIAAVTMSSGDAIYTGTDDKAFTVVVKGVDSLASSSETAIITVNDTKISVAASVLGSSSTTTTLTVDQSGELAKVTISGALATTAGEFTVTSGVYKVGTGSEATIPASEDVGYVDVSSSGVPTVQSGSTKAANASIESGIKELASEASLTESTVTAYQAFGGSAARATLSPAIQSVTSANWASDEAGVEPVAGTKNYGYNIYGNTSLGSAELANITLQANGTLASSAIVIDENEGDNITSAVVNLSNTSSDHAVVIGANGEVSANHTVLGGSGKDTIVFGENATGSNYVQAGSGNTFIYNKSTKKKASLLGGSGNDTIIAAKGDYVAGGTGVDFFRDSADYLVTDYSATSDGDVIIASKLSTSGLTDLDQVTVNGNTLIVNGGGKLTLDSSYDENNSMAAIIAGADGATANAKYVAWASDYGSTVDASSRTAAAWVLGAHNNGNADLLLGGSGNDTIYAGGNDSVVAGAGKDYIKLMAAVAENGDLGAMVALSEGADTVYNWNGVDENAAIDAFDAENGANILYRESKASGLTYKVSGGHLTVSEGSNSLTFGDDLGDTFSFLAGTSIEDFDKVTYIKSGASAVISDADDIADYFIAAKKGSLTFGDGIETSLGAITLGSDKYQNIVYLSASNQGTASIYGASDSTKETVAVAGAASLEAGKFVSLGGGADLITSGGSSTNTAGNVFAFSSGDGKDTIKSFGFYQADDDETLAADTILIGTSMGQWLADGGAVTGKGTSVEIATSASDKVVIDTATSADIVRVKFEDSDAVYNVKTGYTSGSNNNTFAYDENTNVYYGNAAKGKDTITATGSDQSVGIWLTSTFASAGLSDPKGNLYSGINAINATNLTDSTATLVGADNTNSTIVGAGNGSSTSMWGGVGGKNSLVGGNGDDMFFFFQGYGNDDTISNCSTEDKVWLFDVNFADLDLDKIAASGNAGISSSKIELFMTNGSKLTVATPATSTTFRLADGSEYTAVNRGSTTGWE